MDLLVGLPGLIFASAFAYFQRKHHLDGFSVEEKIYTMNDILWAIFSSTLITSLLTYIFMLMSNVDMFGLMIYASAVTMYILLRPAGFFMRKIMKEPKAT